MSYPLPFPRRRARFARCTAGSRLMEGLESRRLLAAPIADAGGPYTAFEGDVLNLDASASSDADNDIVDYTWTLTSGPNSFQAFGVNPSIDYSELVTAGMGNGPLVINISVLVEDSASNTDTSQTTLTLNNSLPNVGISPHANTYAEGNVVTFDAIASDLTTPTLNLVYTWTAHLDAVLLDTATGPFSTFAVTLPNQGNLTVTVSVMDSDGESSTANFTQAIANVLPNFNFVSPSPGTVTEGDVINVFVDASDPADPSLQYRVAVAKHNGTSYVTQFVTPGVFGIGGMIIPISALDEGNWAFQARIDDDVGGKSSTPLRTFTVVNAAPAPTISGAPAGDVDVGDEITLTVDPNDPGTLDTHTYAWTVTRDGDVVATGSDDFITFTADEAGTYEYSVIVTDNAATPGSASGSFDAVGDVDDQAEIAYTGLQHISTDSLSDTTAQITLRATLTDMGADAADIGSAMVSFSVFHPIAGLVYTSQVGVSSADGVVGVAQSSFIYNLSASAAALTVVVEVVGGGYTADSLSVPLTVSRAETGRIVGAGLMLNTNSGGLLAAADGTRTLFAFSARRTSGSLTGVFSMTYQGADGNLYLVVSTDVNSLFTWNEAGVRRAALGAQVSVYNIRNIFNPTLVQSGLALEMRLTDAGSNGQFDRASFAVWNASGGLVFGSYVDPVTNSVTEQLLSSGNISIWES